MRNLPKYKVNIDPAERDKRKRYFAATIVTCIAAAMIFGALHVVKLGANRMEEMRDKATYDLDSMKLHIRAAGEDITLHKVHEHQKKATHTYGVEEVVSLLPTKQWKELETTIAIPEGPFIMGTDSERSDEQNRPSHKATVSGFYIDKYPVTNAEYAKFIVATKHRPPLDWKDGEIPEKKLLHPVTMVSWYDARDYCGWVGKRLPSEAEWEKAARGTDGRRWPWGNAMDPAKLNTYYNVGSTTTVMSYPEGVSTYGVFDMAGNVSEWTDSNFAPYEGSSAPKEIFDAKVAVSKDAADKTVKMIDFVPVDVPYKVRRGGSWKSDPFSTSTYHRNFSLPNFASDFFGFRCAKNP